jgi:hypothetical protein
MLQAEGTARPVRVQFDNFEHGFPEGFGPGGWGRLAYAIGIGFAAFQLVVAAWNVLPTQVVRGRSRRLSASDDLRPDRQLHRQRQCRPHGRLADRQRRVSVRALSMDFLRRPDRATAIRRSSILRSAPCSRF